MVDPPSELPLDELAPDDVVPDELAPDELLEELPPDEVLPVGVPPASGPLSVVMVQPAPFIARRVHVNGPSTGKRRKSLFAIMWTP